MELHESVMSWCSEKRSLIDEPLELSSLGSAKQRLQTFGVSVKSIVHASKNLQEMSRELSRIGQAASSGNLSEKMNEAEHAKAETDCQLNEKVPIMSQCTLRVLWHFHIIFITQKNLGGLRFCVLTSFCN